MIAAVDFETYYDNECSIVTLGVHHYLRHPTSDIYMVSIATDTGIKYVGHPKHFDWTQIAEPDAVWLSHNAQFDLPVFQRLQELKVGNTAEVRDLAAWHDTADLTAFLGYPRSLKEASKYLLGQEISKDTRDKMKGKAWESMTPEFRAEVEQYALKDAENCLNLWLQHGHKWPEHEREISQMTREMALKGVPVDLEGLKKDSEVLKMAIWEAKGHIPWDDEHPVLSLKAARERCIIEGIEPPASFSQADPDTAAWEDRHAEAHPWIKALRTFRKARKHLSTVETMIQRTREDGWMGYGLKYGGAHTMRDSGDTGWNAQNLPKGEVCGVDIRSKIMAPEGYTFAIVDLSQIEPRCLHWLAKDFDTLRYIRQIDDLYEAQARAWGIWDGEGSMKKAAPEIRFMMKQLALGLGYGMGPNKFKTVANVDEREAVRLVNLYRDKNPKVLRLWKELEGTFKEGIKDGSGILELKLPSGRVMSYRDPKLGEGDDSGRLLAKIQRQGKLQPLKFWGGILTENLVQAVARDVFMNRCLEIQSRGIQTIMRVHDEVVCIVPEGQAEKKLKEIITVMSTAPTWAPGLPLAAEGGISKVYKK